MHNSIKHLSNNIYLRIDNSSSISVPPNTALQKAKDQKLKLLLKMDNSTKKTTSPSAAMTHSQTHLNTFQLVILPWREEELPAGLLWGHNHDPHDPLQHPGQGHHRHHLHGPGGPRELQQEDKLHKAVWKRQDFTEGSWAFPDPKNMSEILSKDNITALLSNLEKLDMVLS